MVAAVELSRNSRRFIVHLTADDAVARSGFNSRADAVSRRRAHCGGVSHIVKPCPAILGRFLAAIDTTANTAL
jgi:hypothetical protein